MAVSVRSASTLAVTTALSGGNIVIATPSGLQAGDLMVACIGVNSSTPSTPSGWTEYTTSRNGTATRGFWVFYKTADSSDAAASNFSFPSTGGTGGGVLYAITGHAASSAFQGDGDTGPGNETTVTLSTSLTPLDANYLVIITAVGSDSTSQSTPSAYYLTGGTSPTFTERLETQDGANTEAWAVADAIYASATQITAYGWTDTASISGQTGSIMLIAPQQDAAGTTALHSADADFFAPAASSGVLASTALHTADADLFAPTARATAPTQWTQGTKPSTTWTQTSKYES